MFEDRRAGSSGRLGRLGARQAVHLGRLVATGAEAAVLIELRGVTCRVGDFVLGGIDLTLRAGEQVVLLGSSGAGKTTLLNVLNGQQRPSSGSVRFFGRASGELSAESWRLLQGRIGTVYQDLRLVPNLRVIHNVNAGHLGRWPTWKALLSLLWPMQRETARSALGQVGLADKLDAVTANLSGGEQQRVALARLLIQDPDVILADEPVSGIDPPRSRDVMDLLGRACRRTGKALVASCHTPEFVHSHFDRAIGLRRGSVLFDRPTANLDAASLAALYQYDEPDVGGASAGPRP